MNNSNTNNNLKSLRPGDYFKGSVKIIRKAKPGPVVFLVTNGLGIIEAVTKDSDFQAGEFVYIEGQVQEHQGRIQIELDQIKTSTMNFDEIISEAVKPTIKDFSIQSDRYETMRPTIEAIAARIRKAVLTGQPIMIRHHNDADGITSGLSLEIPVNGLMKDLGADIKYSLFRSPSRAPFYSSGDVLRDIVLSKRFVEDSSNQKPLIIVTDNGSTPGDALGLSILATLGYETIVIDHHNPIQLENGVTAVDPFVSLHLNPYKYGLDSKTSAGMLCYEIGRMVWPKFEMNKIPAVAGIMDRCDIEETEKYIQSTGMPREDLAKIGTAIDYVSYQLKHDAGKGVFEELFNNFEFVQLINSEVKKGFEYQLQSTLPYLRTQNINGIIFSTIDIEKYTMKFTYPSPGLVVSRVHEITSDEYSNEAALTLGYLEDMIIIRASKPILPVQTILSYLQAKFPNANVDGGGHEMAGTIRFVAAHKDAILEEIKDLVKKIPSYQE